MISPALEPRAPLALAPESQNLLKNVFNRAKTLTETNSSTTRCRKKVIVFLSSRVFEYLVVVLIIMYCILVFLNFGINDAATEQDEINKINTVLLIIELSILSFFVLEILMNNFAYGFKYYFRDRLLLFDALIIVGSIALVIVDLITIGHDGSFNLISKIIRGVFRFFRIFLMFRKFNQFKRIKVAYSKYDVKSPVEKIIEILKTAKEALKNEITDVKRIDWCIEVISSNRLYDPILENILKEDNSEGQKEMMNWLSNYSTDQTKKRISGANNGGKDEWRQKRNSIYTIESGKSNSSHMELQLDENVLNLLKKSNDIDFDCFELDKLTHGEGLSILLLTFFKENDLFEKLNIDFDIFKRFAVKIQTGYLSNPYHNSTHAADVTQTVNFFLKSCHFIELANLTYLEMAAMYLGASIHDFEHPGTNNAFHIATRTSLAIKYNDKSVLENHHVSAAFIIAQKEGTDIFRSFSKEDYSKIRERMIALVLCTDMSTHFSDLSKIKGRLATSDFDMKDKDKNTCMETLFHSSDISNPIKPFKIYFEWTNRVLKEFWLQGDEERKLNLPISYLMDRFSVNTAKSQIGFIDVIVQPSFEVIKTFLPDLQLFIQNLENNKNLWKKKIDEYDEVLKLINEKKNEEENSSKTLLKEEN